MKKQSICKMFAQGSCKFGKKCKNLHEKNDEPKICKLFVQGRCKFGTECKFIHEQTNNPNLLQQNEELSLLKQLSSDKEKQIQNQLSNQIQSQNQQKEQQDQQQQQTQKQNRKQSNQSNQSKNKSRKQSRQQYDEEEEQEEEKNNMGEIQGEVKNESGKTFKDITKSTEGKELCEKNLQLLFDGDFMQHVKSLQSFWEKDIAQVQRKYQSSFKFVNREVENYKVFQIKHSPTYNYNDLPNLNYTITEGYLWFEVVLPSDYPRDGAKFELLNSSLPSFFKKVFVGIMEFYYNKNFNKNLMKTFKFMDNNLNEFCKQTEQVMKEKNKIEDQKRKQKEEQKKVWTQEEQTFLQEGIKLFKDVKEKEERWQKISEFVGTKDVLQCLERFQFCKEQAIQRQRKKSSSSEEDESSGDEDDEDYSSEENDGYYVNDDECNDDGDDYFEQDEQEEQQQNQESKQQFSVEFNISSSVKDLSISGISLCRISGCTLSVKCKLCKFPSDLKVRDFYSENSDEVMVNNLVCVNCNHSAQLLLKRLYIHPYGDPVLARMGSATWDILDMRNTYIDINCEECNQKQLIKNYVQGEKRNGSCHSCFKNYQFCYFGIQIQREVSKEIEKQLSQQNQNSTQSNKNEFKKKKIGIYKQGQPLPSNGTCSHYKNSFRYFRFPCCGKAYPCDICHKNAEAKDHEQEMAKAMVCGYCSREQGVKNTCSACQSLLTRISKNGGHWENGKGTRNKVKMCKSDKQKYSGKNKTISRKKAAQHNKK